MNPSELTWITASSELKLNLPIWFSSSSWMLRGRWDGVNLQQQTGHFNSDTLQCSCEITEGRERGKHACSISGVEDKNICFISVKNVAGLWRPEDSPVHAAVILQCRCDENRPRLGFVFLFSDLKLNRPQVKVEVIETELWSHVSVQPAKNHSE